MKPKAFIGVDPGLSGAISVISEEGELLFCEDMPKRKDVSKNTVDIWSLSKNEEFKDYLFLWEPHIAIERVNPMPAGGTSSTRQQGIASTGSFMRAAGKIEGFFEAYGFEPRLVVPTVWKRYFDLLKKDKFASVVLARTYWASHVDIFLKSKDGRAESALIAEWLRETYSEGK